MKLKTLLACIALGGATLFGPAQAEEMKYASLAPPGSPWAKLIHALIDTAAAKSGGAVKIKAFLGGQLGKEPDVIQQVARGRIDMGGFSLTATALVVPELALLGAPYLWDDLKQMECALDDHLIESLQPHFAERGLVLLGWGEVGYQLVFAKKPMTKASDFEGAKLRVAPAKGSVMAFKSIGVNGVVIPATDTNSSIQTGLVDGAETPLVYAVLTGAGQLAPHVNMTRHVYLPSLTVMSKKSFDKLDPDQQTIVLTSSVPPQEQRAVLRAVEQAMIKKLTDAGGRLHELEEGEVDKLRSKMTATHPMLVEDVAGNADKVWEAIMAAKAACT